MLDEGVYTSVSEIGEAEGIDKGYLLGRWAGLDWQANWQPQDRAQALATPARLN